MDKQDTQEKQQYIFNQIDPAPFTIEQIKEYIVEAQKIKTIAYCPYSKFQVGCVIVDQDNNVFKGVNVENASYGLTVCAERNTIFQGVAHGLKTIKLIVVNCKTERVGSPCGACRQVIGEFATPQTIVVLSNDKGQYEITTFDAILPGAFTPKDLFTSPKE